MWQEMGKSEAQKAKIPCLGELMPFLADLDSPIRQLPALLDMSAEAGALPLVTAPLLLSGRESRMGAEDGEDEAQADTEPALRPRSPIGGVREQAYPLGGEAVSLQDFADFVKNTPPGHLFHSSHLSDTGDLYLRSEEAIVVIAFTDSTVPLTGLDVFRKYSDAVGEPEWWGVELVSYVLFCGKASQPMLQACGRKSCAHYKPGESLDGSGAVRAGSEIIFCRPETLSSLLGIKLQAALQKHQRIVDGIPEAEKPGAATRAGRRGGSKSAGAARNAVADWRARRPKATSKAQLEANLESLEVLLEHVNEHTQLLLDTLDEIVFDGQPSSVAMSRWDVMPKLPVMAAVNSRKEEPVSPSPHAPSALKKSEDEDKKDALIEHLKSEEKDDENFLAARVERRPSPIRTALSLSWRPPTPHPRRCKDPGKQERERRPPPQAAFAFLGLGAWQMDFMSLDDRSELGRSEYGGKSDRGNSVSPHAPGGGREGRS